VPPIVMPCVGELTSTPVDEPEPPPPHDARAAIIKTGHSFWKTFFMVTLLW
jgi:hypothetical protein